MSPHRQALLFYSRPLLWRGSVLHVPFGLSYRGRMLLSPVSHFGCAEFAEQREVDFPVVLALRAHNADGLISTGTVAGHCY